MELTELIESGVVTPVIDSVWPLDHIRDAVDVVARGDAQGKVIVSV